jgi:predicted DCC family thiol-disulfide oxidoreductase YuxK
MEHPVILFDGVCNFCNGTINFVIKEDKKGVFRFAPLQSAIGQKLLQEYGLPPTNFNSFVLIQRGKAFQKSAAALQVLKQLPWYWQWTQLFWIVPSFMRNAVYDVIAKNRYRWFGKKDACMIPTADMRSRFLMDE